MIWTIKISRKIIIIGAGKAKGNFGHRFSKIKFRSLVRKKFDPRPNPLFLDIMPYRRTTSSVGSWPRRQNLLLSMRERPAHLRSSSRSSRRRRRHRRSRRPPRWPKRSRLFVGFFRRRPKSTAAAQIFITEDECVS